MKLSFLGICAAGAAAILLQTGVSAHSSQAIAAESCIVVNVAKHVKKCPPGVSYKAGAHSASAAEPQPTITPTAAPAPGCIKTNVAKHVKKCPA